MAWYEYLWVRRGYFEYYHERSKMCPSQSLHPTFQGLIMLWIAQNFLNL
ncbi:MAG: hypothetical protein SBU_001297 [Candidatus Syntrophoarchaeum butanivorans]|uniref:Uncharacterized protein n=1 Tax=Candidatus Syntropharchaeum butanivorans TaxID=1839936 RepID=A0A1F2P3F2_9EURY|nr:MAG: hypothetical protein SBU_001297 [Candidatus Syntrophoarchaeum butanivorans]